LHVKRAKNGLKFFLKLVRAVNNREKRAALAAEIEKTPFVAERKWLLAKATAV
jgi:hypothetical protein